MNVAAAVAFSDVHLSDKKDTDDLFLQGGRPASPRHDGKLGTNERRLRLNRCLLQV